MFKRFRADGWPLCPHCEQDEVWSRLDILACVSWTQAGEKPPLQAFIDAGMGCYHCGWDTDHYVDPAAAAPYEGIQLMLSSIDANEVIAALRELEEEDRPCDRGLHEWDVIVDPDVDGDGNPIPGGYPGWSVCPICGAKRMNDQIGGH